MNTEKGMTISALTFEFDGVKYSWTNHWDGVGGNLYSEHGDGLASLELVQTNGGPQPDDEHRTGAYWVVESDEDVKKVDTAEGGYEYVHAKLGDPRHSSFISAGDAVAMANFTLTEYLKSKGEG